jgi:L-alanine-DL-glutamate epimerase-like enolase superfamily enzyme
MRITQLESQVLRLPLTRPFTAANDAARGRIDHAFLLLVHLDTDSGHRGLGFAYTLAAAGRALQMLTNDDIAPLVVGEDPLDHERLGAKVARRLQGVGRSGLVAQVYSAVDLALWDLKGKTAGLPLYKLLGGARESAPVYASDAGWLWMSPEEIIEASQPYLEQGMMGIKVKVGSPDPETDAERVTRIRETLGEDIWLAVDANQRYDYGTALSMGHFFEEEIGADWFEEPIACDDIDGHSRLSDRLEIPLALGETLYSCEEFQAYLARKAVDVLQPSVTRVGGLTNWLKIAALADVHHRPLSPHAMPELVVHLACGLPQVRMVEYLPFLAPAFVETPAISNGQIFPLRRPGLGLELSGDAVEKYRVEI